MTDPGRNPENPFGMIDFAPGGPYTLGHELCTDWRKEYLRRGNTVLAAYSMILCYSDMGNKHIESLEANGKVNAATFFRFGIGKKFIQCKYSQLKGTYGRAQTQLSNQAFLMVYGNLEAYLVDLVTEAFAVTGSPEPSQDALTIMARAKWEGKIDSIGQRFGLELGKRQFADRFQNVKMEMENESFTEPIAFLQRIAEIRHLLVHSAGRLGDSLVRRFPQTGLTNDTVITIPTELPFELHVFLTGFSDVFDKAFSEKFGWARKIVKPHELVET